MAEQVVGKVKDRHGVSNRQLAALATQQLGHPVNAGQFSRKLSPELRAWMGRLLQQKALSPDKVPIRDPATGKIRPPKRPKRKKGRGATPPRSPKPIEDKIKFRRRGRPKKGSKGIKRLLFWFTCRTESKEKYRHKFKVRYGGKTNILFYAERGAIAKHNRAHPDHEVLSVEFGDAWMVFE